MAKETYGDAAMGRWGAFKWHKLFEGGNERMENDDRPERPSTSKADVNGPPVKNLLNSDRRMNIRIISDVFNITQTHFWLFRDRQPSYEESVHEVGTASAVKGAKGQPKSDLPEFLHHVNEDPALWTM